MTYLEYKPLQPVTEPLCDLTFVKKSSVGDVYVTNELCVRKLLKVDGTYYELDDIAYKILIGKPLTLTWQPEHETPVLKMYEHFEKTTEGKLLRDIVMGWVKKHRPSMNDLRKTKEVLSSNDIYCMQRAYYHGTLSKKRLPLPSIINNYLNHELVEIDMSVLEVLRDLRWNPAIRPERFEDVERLAKLIAADTNQPIDDVMHRVLLNWASHHA